MAAKSGQDEASSERGQTRIDAVYSSLRTAIIERAIQPGTKLPEDAVGETFGVSRTIVRAALAQLRTEGLVDQEPNKRAQVATPTLEEAREVFAVRWGLERSVMEQLAGRLNPAQLTRLRGHIEKEEKARDRDPDSGESIRLSGEFHNLLAEMASNGLLKRYVNEVISRCSLLLALYGRHHSADCAVNEHSLIVDALAKGDTKAATAQMETHLKAVAERALLDEKHNPKADLRELLSPYARRGAAG